MAAFGLHTLVSIEVLKGYDPSYVVFGKQCMQCVIPGSLIVAGDVTVFRPKGIAFRTSVFCLVEFHVSQIRPGKQKRKTHMGAGTRIPRKLGTWGGSSCRRHIINPDASAAISP